jgi:hypothetical protein
LNVLLDAALELAALGCHVIPVEPRGKKPLVEWKKYQTEKPTDLDLRVWWEATADANVGIILGRGTLAVDVDRGGDQSLRDHGIEFPADAPTVRTPSGGYHKYLSGDVPDKVGLLPGVDLRGVGFCVAPPSVGNDGSPYTWETRITDLRSLPAVPASLLALLTKEDTSDGLYAPDSPGWVTELLTAGSGQGTRNADGTRLAGYLYRQHPPDIAKALLHLWNTRNTPPLPDREIEAIAASIARRTVGEQSLSLVSPDNLRREALAKSDARVVGSILGDLGKTIHVPTRFIETPYPSLNTLLFGGLTRSEYVLMGGRPSVGKTAMGLQFAKVAAELGHRVLIVTLEMSSAQLGARLAVLWSGLPAGTVRRGGLSGPDLDKFRVATEEIQRLDIVIESGLTAAEEIHSLVAKSPVPYDLVIIDYLQCLRPLVPNRQGDRRHEVDHASAVLKRIPRQLNVPLIAVSSLARGIGAPRMQELKESGGLEYDADVIILLHREKFDRRIQVTVDKARDAQVGVFHLFYDGNRFSFSETDTLLPEGEYEKPF